VLIIKILSLGAPERYAVRRVVTLAMQELQARHPQQDMIITEVDDAAHIGKYAAMLVLPTLVVNEKVVCSGRFPTREEILGWLTGAVEQ
jgi:hypothetical protein